MSRKHYISFAKMFASLRDGHKGNDGVAKTLDVVIGEFCDLAKQDNPRFDCDKFKTAAKAGA